MDSLKAYGHDVKSSVTFTKVVEVLGETEISVAADQTTVVLQAMEDFLGKALKPLYTGQRAGSFEELSERLSGAGLSQKPDMLSHTLNSVVTTDEVVILFEDHSITDSGNLLLERILLAMEPVKATSEILDTPIWNVYQKRFS